MSLAAPALHAQTAPAASANDPVDPVAVQALKNTGSYLQTLECFEVKTELTGERVPPGRFSQSDRKRFIR